jgi:hypothetical protein
MRGQRPIFLTDRSPSTAARMRSGSGQPGAGMMPGGGDSSRCFKLSVATATFIMV